MEKFSCFTSIIDNLCQNALDLTNGKLIVNNNWPLGTYCQWLISAEDENSYITLEFENLNVSYEITHLEKTTILKFLKNSRLTNC